MAEFQEVMKQRKRMCGELDCCDCSISRINNGFNHETCTGLMANHPAEAEALIMKWAAEHPEQVYPSWNDAWRQLFPDAYWVNSPCPNHFLQKERSMPCDYRVCTDCKSQPIPADIANKLGIEPINQ